MESQDLLIGNLNHHKINFDLKVFTNTLLYKCHKNRILGNRPQLIQGLPDLKLQANYWIQGHHS